VVIQFILMRKIMKKIWLVCVFMMLSLFALQASAQSVADIKTQLIAQMQKDGYIGSKTADEVVQKYVTKEDTTTHIAGIKSDSDKLSVIPSANEVSVASVSSSWSKYLTLFNIIKVIGIAFLLFAFRGFITKMIVRYIKIIKKVPVEIYQAVLAIASVVGTIHPQWYWASQAFYVALFCSIANLVLLGWIAESHEKIAKAIIKFFNFGIPAETVASLLGVVYFGTLSIIHHSQIFGFMTAICISATFSFTMFYNVGVLFLYFKENALLAMIVGHLVVLGGYIALMHNDAVASYLVNFNSGIQYYCTIAIGVALLVGASPFEFSRKNTGETGFYVLLFIVLAVLAVVGYSFMDVQVMASIILCFFVLFLIEWVGYLGFQGGVIFGSFILGGSLYALALVLEHFSSLLVFHLI
jgi:hypothetical protein